MQDNFLKERIVKAGGPCVSYRVSTAVNG